MAIERSEIERLAKDRDDERAIQERSFLNRLREKLLSRKASGGFKGIKAGTAITEDVLAEHPRGAWAPHRVQDDAVMAEIETLKREFDAAVGPAAAALRRQGREAAARRRAAAGRDEGWSRSSSR